MSGDMFVIPCYLITYSGCLLSFTSKRNSRRTPEFAGAVQRHAFRKTVTAEIFHVFGERCKSVSLSVSQSASQSVSQSASQSVIQSVSQPVSQSVSRSVTITLWYLNHTDAQKQTLHDVFDLWLCRRRCKSDYSCTSSVLQVDLHGVT
jgi:hypothetical protein